MRQKRAKTYKRVMALYTQAFNFRQPFQILVSDDIIQCTNTQSDLWKQLAACVQAEIKPMITQCCMEALYKLGREHQHLVDIAKSFERRRCNHREPIPRDECLKDVIGENNKHRYILSSQSKNLRQTLSAIPGLPIIHFNPRGVLVLSPPSHSTLVVKDRAEEERRLEGTKVLDGVVDGGNVLASGGVGTGVAGVKRQRVKGVNPLSIKKKKGPAPIKNGEGVRKKRSEREGDEREEEDGDGHAGKRKKRKRRGKGEVALAIEELNSTNQPSGIIRRSESVSEADSD